MNAYPGKPMIPFERTKVTMEEVVNYLKGMAAEDEHKRAAYVIFRNESGNGMKGINNNYVGAQADGDRWGEEWDDDIIGIVEQRENMTGISRLFLAFTDYSVSLRFLINRIMARGLFIGGETHLILKMEINDAFDLARAYYKEWVTGEAEFEPDEEDLQDFISMYEQGEDLIK